jgi:glycosyltransferase involved in cell wall biosynthesis
LLCDAALVILTDEPIFALTVPAKIQSYLASQKPLIASLNGEGARIILEAGAGLTCPAEQPKKLAETVLKMKAKSNEELQSMGRKGYEYFLAHFEEALVISQIENLCLESIRKQS